MKNWAVRKGLALIRCGGLLSAVRIPTDLVRAAAGSDNLREIDAFLANVLPGGPVFADQHGDSYYVLVPSSTRRRAEWATGSRRNSGAEFLGMGSYLDVPRPEATNSEAGHSYWCVPVTSPGALADPDTVSRFLTFALRRQEQAAEEPPGSPPLTPGTA
ncbi:hypothetical protein [Streptomyces sp. T028]|uniref:hypothetical protein n=1 Tax=Streptomyces sp. T028 TaxID=3394379 RepID=UPI003A876145